MDAYNPFYGISVPITIGDRNHVYTADMLGPPSENVPALIGIPDMAAVGVFIDCRRGKFIIPGPGGLKIEASPGTTEVQMNKESHWLLGVEPPFNKDRPRSQSVPPRLHRAFTHSGNRVLSSLAYESPI